MPESMLPDDVRQFILQNIESIAELEGLLLLRAERGSSWTVAQVAQRLYVDDGQAAHLLVRLCHAGLLAMADNPVCYRYEPQKRDLENLTDRLAETYALYLLPVTHLIHARPKTRVQEFADAFRITRKDKE